MLNMQLEGKLALVTGVADDRGYGWAIARALREAGARVAVACWVPAYPMFQADLVRGRFESPLAPEKVYPLDARFDRFDDVPLDVRAQRHYATVGDFSVEGLRGQLERDFGRGTLAVVVHAIANAPEVAKPLLETSRRGYGAAQSASSYSFVSLVRSFSPVMERRGSFLTLSFLAADRVVPGYGGGMSSAKAALESDVRTLAFEAGRRYGHRVNAIRAGVIASWASSSLRGSVEDRIRFYERNAPLAERTRAADVAGAVVFLSSPLAGGITGSVVPVDMGVHAMGMSISGEPGST
jgi:enoyl-[acyl-carrier protein] reductase I